MADQNQRGKRWKSGNGNHPRRPNKWNTDERALGGFGDTGWSYGRAEECANANCVVEFPWVDGGQLVRVHCGNHLAAKDPNWVNKWGKTLCCLDLGQAWGVADGSDRIPTGHLFPKSHKPETKATPEQANKVVSDVLMWIWNLPPGNHLIYCKAGRHRAGFAAALAMCTQSGMMSARNVSFELTRLRWRVETRAFQTALTEAFPAAVAMHHDMDTRWEAIEKKYREVREASGAENDFVRANFIGQKYWPANTRDTSKASVWDPDVIGSSGIDDKSVHVPPQEDSPDEEEEEEEEDNDDEIDEAGDRAMQQALRGNRVEHVPGIPGQGKNKESNRRKKEKRREQRAKLEQKKQRDAGHHVRTHEDAAVDADAEGDLPMPEAAVKRPRRKMWRSEEAHEKRNLAKANKQLQREMVKSKTLELTKKVKEQVKLLQKDGVEGAKKGFSTQDLTRFWNKEWDSVVGRIKRAPPASLEDAVALTKYQVDASTVDPTLWDIEHMTSARLHRAFTDTREHMLWNGREWEPLPPHSQPKGQPELLGRWSFIRTNDVGRICMVANDFEAEEGVSSSVSSDEEYVKLGKKSPGIAKKNILDAAALNKSVGKLTKQRAALEAAEAQNLTDEWIKNQARKDRKNPKRTLSCSEDSSPSSIESDVLEIMNDTNSRMRRRKRLRAAMAEDEDSLAFLLEMSLHAQIVNREAKGENGAASAPSKESIDKLRNLILSSSQNLSGADHESAHREGTNSSSSRGAGQGAPSSSAHPVVGRVQEHELPVPKNGGLVAGESPPEESPKLRRLSNNRRVPGASMRFRRRIRLVSRQRANGTRYYNNEKYDREMDHSVCSPARGDQDGENGNDSEQFGEEETGKLISIAEEHGGKVASESPEDSSMGDKDFEKLDEPESSVSASSEHESSEVSDIVEKSRSRKSGGNKNQDKGLHSRSYSKGGQPENREWNEIKACEEQGFKEVRKARNSRYAKNSERSRRSRSRSEGNKSGKKRPRVQKPENERRSEDNRRERKKKRDSREKKGKKEKK